MPRKPRLLLFNYDYGKALELYQGLGDYKDCKECAEKVSEELVAINRKQRVHHGIVLAILAAVVAAIVGFFTSDLLPYTIARIYEKAGWEDAAITSYQNADGIFDSEERIEKVQAGKDARAVHNNYVNFTEGAPGKECFFGKYKWLILDRQGDYALMFLTNFVILEHEDLWQIPYNTEQTQVGWLDCSLRSYLNSEVLENDFNDVQRACLMPISAQDGPLNVPAEGGETDYVSILSEEGLTEYQKIVNKLGGIDYWLRDEGTVPGTAAAYSAMDRVFDTGIPVSACELGVRPIILVNTAGIKEEDVR